MGLLTKKRLAFKLQNIFRLWEFYLAIPKILSQHILIVHQKLILKPKLFFSKSKYILKFKSYSFFSQQDHQNFAVISYEKS